MQCNQKLPNLLDWLLANSKTTTLHDELKKVEFKCDSVKGLGCFAKTDFAVGDILFTIPRKCIIGYNTAKFNELLQELRSLFQELQSNSSFQLASSWSCEFVIFLYMIEQIYDANEDICFHKPYLCSLEYENIPGILSWSTDLKECFLGTNLKPTLDNTELNLIHKLELLKQLIARYEEKSTTPNSSNVLEKYLAMLKQVDIKSLTWAWSHYLSRRYPGNFAPSNSSSRNEQLSVVLNDGREEGLANLGSLVPLLDILNHDYSENWLTFQINEEELLVICNHPVQKVSYLSFIIYHFFMYCQAN